MSTRGPGAAWLLLPLPGSSLAWGCEWGWRRSHRAGCCLWHVLPDRWHLWWLCQQCSHDGCGGHGGCGSAGHGGGFGGIQQALSAVTIPLALPPSPCRWVCWDSGSPHAPGDISACPWPLMCRSSRQGWRDGRPPHRHARHPTPCLLGWAWPAHRRAPLITLLHRSDRDVCHESGWRAGQGTWGCGPPRLHHTLPALGQAREVLAALLGAPRCMQGGRCEVPGAELWAGDAVPTCAPPEPCPRAWCWCQRSQNKMSDHANEAAGAAD